eukprot:Gb_35808 [translate_table: standard]
MLKGVSVLQVISRALHQ